MIRFAPVLVIAPLLVAASAPLAQPAPPLDAALAQARAEQAAAEAQTRHLEQVAADARGEAARLQAEQAAAAQALQASEARITAADMQLRIVSEAAAVRRARLLKQQQPVSSLLAGLAMMSRRPPLLALAGGEGGNDDFVKVRVLLDSTLPVIRRRTAALSAELAEGEWLERAAVAARAELVRSREQLGARRIEFAALERRAVTAATAAGGQALASGDVALASGEDVEKLSSAAASSRSAWSMASELAAGDPAPPRPVPPERGNATAPFPYQLPAAATVTDGLGAVNESGVRSRGLTLATPRGAAVAVPASGIVRFAGPYRSHDGVVIIDHGRGWLSLIVNVATPLKAGARVRISEPLGRALGPIGVELSQNGRRLSPALIAGSSPTLSNAAKGG
jgi:septal ring factor EnvC (AmiA/AmiB activator)